MLPDRTSQGRYEQFGDGDGSWPKSRSWSPVWVIHSDIVVRRIEVTLRAMNDPLHCNKQRTFLPCRQDVAVAIDIDEQALTWPPRTSAPCWSR
jgi:hypothetical protein